MCLVTDPSSSGSRSANGNEIHFAYEGRSIIMLLKYASALGSWVAKPQEHMHETNNTLHNHCYKVPWDSPKSRSPFLGCHKIKRTCMAFQFTKEIRRITKSHQWDSGRRCSWNKRSDDQGTWVIHKIDVTRSIYLDTIKTRCSDFDLLSLNTQLSATVSSNIVVLNVFILWNFIYVYTMYLDYIYPSSSLQLSPGVPPNSCVCVCAFFNLLGPISTTMYIWWYPLKEAWGTSQLVHKENSVKMS